MSYFKRQPDKRICTHMEQIAFGGGGYRQEFWSYISKSDDLRINTVDKS